MGDQSPLLVGLLRQARIVTTTIALYLAVVFLVLCALLWFLCMVWEPLEDNVRTVGVSACASAIGSFIYFLRKCYVYLITDKFGRVLQHTAKDGAVTDCVAEKFRTRLWGYYLYLGLRPHSGVVIGPIVYLFATCGLLVLNTNAGSSLSQTGCYLVVLFAFIGGHASSDMFDHLTKLARKRFDAELKANE